MICLQYSTTQRLTISTHLCQCKRECQSSSLAVKCGDIYTRCKFVFIPICNNIFREELTAKEVACRICISVIDEDSQWVLRSDNALEYRSGVVMLLLIVVVHFQAEKERNNEKWKKKWLPPPPPSPNSIPVSITKMSHLFYSPLENTFGEWLWQELPHKKIMLRTNHSNSALSYMLLQTTDLRWSI